VNIILISPFSDIDGSSLVKKRGIMNCNQNNKDYVKENIGLFK